MEHVSNPLVLRTEDIGSNINILVWARGLKANVSAMLIYVDDVTEGETELPIISVIAQGRLAICGYNRTEQAYCIIDKPIDLIPLITNARYELGENKDKFTDVRDQ